MLVTRHFTPPMHAVKGTLLGKVHLYSFEERQAEILAAFSDEGVRGLYLDQENGYATLTDGCKGWRHASPHLQAGAVNFRSLDRKNTQSVKHVLQRGPWACVLFPISSTVVNVTRQEHHHRAFKLFDFGNSSEVAPCDFDGETLAIVDRSRAPGPPVFRLVQLERNELLEIDNLPNASRVSLIKLWGPDCLVAVTGSTLLVYDYRQQQLRHTLRLGAEIVAVDAQDSEIIGSLAKDASVKLWSGRSGDCLQTLQMPEAPGVKICRGVCYLIHAWPRRTRFFSDRRQFAD
ncbi:unnamed protein product [Polarella glacialis]|uniref:Uncharacterized protein n=1 Tax=Polarella glacialis TaxID=89957 RepID=A0A813HAY9_POLGL|nr:unnamed protein product [Polarella glacialis]